MKFYKIPLLPITGLSPSEGFTFSDKKNWERIETAIEEASIAITVNSWFQFHDLKNGTIILLKKLSIKDKINPNEKIVLDTRYGTIIGIPDFSLTGENIILKTANPDAPSWEIPKSLCYEIYRIVGKINQY